MHSHVNLCPTCLRQPPRPVGGSSLVLQVQWEPSAKWSDVEFFHEISAARGYVADVMAAGIGDATLRIISRLTVVHEYIVEEHTNEQQPGIEA